jgi:hypothetical protein
VLRKLRNAFAHSAESASLNDDSHRMRLAAVYADARTNPLWGPLAVVLAAQPPSWLTDTSQPRDSCNCQQRRVIGG